MIKIIMILLGVIFLLLVFNFIMAIHHGKRKINERFAAIVIVSIVLIGLLVKTSKGEQRQKRIEIYSLGLNKGSVNAQSFFLGLNGVQYLYYTGDSISGFDLQSIPARITTIKYTNDKPYIRLFEEIYPRNIFSDEEKKEVVAAELYLPYGSIVKDYKIDL